MNRDILFFLLASSTTSREYITGIRGIIFCLMLEAPQDLNPTLVIAHLTCSSIPATRNQQGIFYPLLIMIPRKSFLPSRKHFAPDRFT